MPAETLEPGFHRHYCENEDCGRMFVFTKRFGAGDLVSEIPEIERRDTAQRPATHTLEATPQRSDQPESHSKAAEKFQAIEECILALVEIGIDGMLAYLSVVREIATWHEDHGSITPYQSSCLKVILKHLEAVGR
jgi:hypothetical protein